MDTSLFSIESLYLVHFCGKYHHYSIFTDNVIALHHQWTSDTLLETINKHVKGSEGHNTARFDEYMSKWWWTVS